MVSIIFLRLEIGVGLDGIASESYASRMINNKWNSLPNSVVSANTTNTFKVRLDKFWHNQNIVYDFRAQLQGTGSRSEVLSEEF